MKRYPTLHGHLNEDVGNLCGWPKSALQEKSLCLVALAFNLEYLYVLAKFFLVLRSLVVILVNRLLSVVLPISICSLGTYLLVVSLSVPRLIA
jgi:hypothetical protein